MDSVLHGKVFNIMNIYGIPTSYIFVIKKRIRPNRLTKRLFLTMVNYKVKNIIKE